jgi:hypothetical protein
MFKKLVMLSILALIFVSCSAPLMMKAESNRTADEQFALVTFLRPGSGLTSFVSGDQPSEIWDSDKLIGVLKGDQSFQYKTKAGKHIFISRAGNWSYLEADLQPNKHYVVFVKSTPGFGGINIILIPVTKDGEWFEKSKGWSKKCVLLEPIVANMELYEKKFQKRVQNSLKKYKDGEAEALFLDPADSIDEF